MKLTVDQSMQKTRSVKLNPGKLKLFKVMYKELIKNK